MRYLKISSYIDDTNEYDTIYFQTLTNFIIYN